MESLKACPICGAPDQRHIRDCVDHTVSRETFSIVECGKCSFQFTNPRPGPSEIGRYYESEEYISHSGKTRGIIGKAYRWVRSITLKNKLQLVLGATKKTSKEIRLLDIGCGTGEFLWHCKGAGLAVLGLEPSDKARRFAKEQYELGVFPEEGIKELEPSTFDVITMWHVLEHVHNLKGRVEEVYALLKVGGLVIVAVPNRDSYDAKHYGSDWAAYDLPRHLYHFTRSDIVQLFEPYSFSLLETIPMKFDSYYVSMLSDKHRGRGNIIGSTWNGFISNMKASTGKGTWSSQIYILRKEKRN